MTSHITSILSDLTKITSLCFGVLATAQLSTQASIHTVENSHPSQSNLQELVSIANNTGIATSDRYFVPPSDDTRPLPPTGTGSVGRGGSCDPDSETTPFTVLGPVSTLGLTTLERPEFSWYVSPSEEGTLVVLDLMKIEEDGRETPIYFTELTAQTGFMSHQLPSDAPSLTVEQNYLWEVSIFCENGDILTGTLPIRVVSPGTELSTQLSDATTDSERAIIYGQAGLWYDAFAQAMSSADGEFRTRLLRDLATAEAENQTLSTILLAIADEIEAR